LIELVLLLN